jgi:DNA-nicking Smr family endonuclease
MRRPLKPEELRLWSTVAATVHPLPGRMAAASPEPPTAKEAIRSKARPGPSPTPRFKPAPGPVGPQVIEPNRRRRIVGERDEIGARIDLHGMDQDKARAALEAFLARAWDQGYRAVLVITGKGARGDGVLKRRTPEWLADGRLQPIVAGLAEAHRRHGGEGALYVALKRKPRS